MGLAYLNWNAQAQSLGWQNDFGDGSAYHRRMATPRWDVYLKEWLRALGKTQADVAKDLDWNKAKVSLIANGKQPYMRDDINQLAEYLNLRPFELLMHPDDAFGIRRLRAEMIRLAHEVEDNEAPKKVSLN